MPKGSKKRKAIKRKKETANPHQSSTNDSGTQGNGTGGYHDSSDHPLSDEDFSPHSAMEAPPNPEPDLDPEPVVAVSKEASVVSEPEPAVGKVTSVVIEPELEVEPEPAVSKEALVVPVEQQNVLEPEQIEAVSGMSSEVLDEPSASFQVQGKSGEESVYHEQTEVPEPKLAVSEMTSYIHIEQLNLSGLEQTEEGVAVTMEVLEEPYAAFGVEKKSGELSLHDDQTEFPEAISLDAPAARYAHLLERRASWWNCCGLLDVFGGARR